jgi:hypothetical protein
MEVRKMLRKIWFVGIVLVLLSISIVPAIAADVPTGTPGPAPDSSAKVVKIGDKTGAGAEVVRSTQIGTVRYGPIYAPGVTTYVYVGYGGTFTGYDTPVVVAGLSIPYTYPYYGAQQFSISTLSNYVTNSYTYVTITRNYPYSSGNLTGSYINLIGVKLT